MFQFTTIQFIPAAPENYLRTEEGTKCSCLFVFDPRLNVTMGTKASVMVIGTPTLKWFDILWDAGKGLLYWKVVP